MKTLFCFFFTAALAQGAFAKECKKGKPCGDTCISKDATCTEKSPPKSCKTGKPCGDTCIAKDAVCKK